MHCLLMVLLVGKLDSLLSLHDWIGEHEKTRKSMKVLVGNKSGRISPRTQSIPNCMIDIPSSSRQVTRAEAEDFAAKRGMTYFETRLESSLFHF